MNGDNFDGGKKSTCPTCGAAIVRFETKEGSVIRFPVSDKRMYDYFASRDDINDFIFDRLLRAERIISRLRAEIVAINSKMNGRG